MGAFLQVQRTHLSFILFIVTMVMIIMLPVLAFLHSLSFQQRYLLNPLLAEEGVGKRAPTASKIPLSLGHLTLCLHAI